MLTSPCTPSYGYTSRGSRGGAFAAILNFEADRMAQAIAHATGETMTSVVTEVLRERYERIQKRDPEALAADIRAIARRAAAHLRRSYLDHAELLYDEHGLPK